MGDVKFYLSGEKKNRKKFTHGLSFSKKKDCKVSNLILSQNVAFHGQKMTLSPKGYRKNLKNIISLDYSANFGILSARVTHLKKQKLSRKWLWVIPDQIKPLSSINFDPACVYIHTG